ncbi:MAG TPA: hypothetical protein VG389_25790 [Myxococcota bacterium]|nr:hypothetical protein [Myxococcota bacterium]
MLLRLWEAARGGHALDRAVALLQLAAPGVGGAAVAALPLGRRDAALLALRRRLFGNRASCFAACPACAAAVEIDLDLSAMLAAPAAEGPFELERDGWVVRFRLPTTEDLVAIRKCAGGETARALLLSRCVSSAVREGLEMEAASMPPDVAAALDARMAEADPLADVEVRVACPACRHEWLAPFDVDTFLAEELGAQGRRLLREVDRLARAYGWSEDAILSLSPLRRQAYLELASA